MNQPQQVAPPLKYNWFWISSGFEGGPGRVKIQEAANTQNSWEIHIAAFDQIAQKYLMDRTAKTGQPVTMPDGRVLEVPYDRIDNAADEFLARGPSPSRDPMTVIFRDDIRMDNVTMDFWEELIKAHLQRRKSEPALPLDFGNGNVVQIPFENWDAICKDFMRRRGDIVSAGKWPELIHKDEGQFEKGPKPVEGRANALGQGVSVAGQPPPGQQTPGQPPPAPAGNLGPSAHPGLDNEGMI